MRRIQPANPSDSDRPVRALSSQVPRGSKASPLTRRHALDLWQKPAGVGLHCTAQDKRLGLQPAKRARTGTGAFLRDPEGSTIIFQLTYAAAAPLLASMLASGGEGQGDTQRERASSTRPSLVLVRSKSAELFTAKSHISQYWLKPIELTVDTDSTDPHF